MKKDQKTIILNIGVLVSAVLCILTAFAVIYHASRYREQDMDRSINKNAPATAHSPVTAKKNETQQEMLETALKKKPDHIPVLLELAQVEAGAGNTQKASEYLKEALQYEPQNLEAKLNLGKQMYEMGHIEDAIRLTKEILEIQPAHPDALYNLGAIYGNLGNREQALYFWKRLIDSNPDTASGLRAREMMAKL